MTEPAADLLGQIEGLLARQLAEARQNRFDEVQAIGRRIDGLVRQATECATSVDDATRARIHALQTELELIVKQRLDEVGDARARLRCGKSTLQAYRRGVV
jgi:hypothetical protein